MRIVPLAPSNTDILRAIGAEDKIVGSTHYCDVDGEKIGGWTNPSLDKIASLKPDILLGSMFIPQRIVEWAEKEGVETRVYSPRTIEDIFLSIRDIGKLAGASLRAELLITEMKLKMNNIKRAGRELSKTYRVRVYCEEFHSPPIAAGNWVPELVKLAGGAPFMAPGEPSRKVLKEEVERFSPELVVLHWCGKGKNIDLNVIRERDWKITSNVTIIHDSLLNRPSNLLLRGLEELHHNIRKAYSSLV